MPFVHRAASAMQLTSHLHPNVTLASHTARAHLQGMKNAGISSFALFLDISHAFYRVLRQFAVGADCSDENVMEFLRRMDIEEYSLQDIIDMLGGRAHTSAATTP